MNNRGLSLIELMVVVGIASVVMAALTSLGSVVLKQQSQSNMTFQADNTRRAMVSLLNNPIAWDKTIHNPANGGSSGTLDCIYLRKPCTTDGSDTVANAIKNSPINVITDTLGNPLYDLRDKTTGYDFSGQPCTGFVTPTGSAPTGTDSCPLRFEVTWSASCTPDTCTNPLPQISVTALYNPSNSASSRRLAFNPNNYSQTFFQGMGEQCWNMQKGGLIDTCAGNVGVGLPSPTEAFEVSGNVRADGQLTTGSFVTNTTAINWNNGNQQASSAPCGTYSFANMRDGGTYSLVVTDAGTGACSFSSTITGTGAGAVTYYYRPANNVRIANSMTTYTFMRIGSTVVVSWASGFKP